MIINCEQCNKKFEIESNLIPKNGRLLQCSSCGHKWFYKKNTSEENKIILKNHENKKNEIKPATKENNNIKIFNDFESSGKTERKHSYKKIKNGKISSLNFILVFIISIVALIILIDTFKNPISIVVPNIKFILESLYETLRDILLFIQDLS